MSTMDTNSGGGGKIAGRVTSIATQAYVATKQAMAGHNRNLAAGMLEDFFDKVSGEIRHTTGGLWVPLADHESTPDSVRPMFQFLARGNGQWQTFLGGAVTGQAVGAGLGGLLTDILAPVTQRLIAENPNLLLSTADAASAVARGMTAGFDMGYEAMQQGINRDKFDVLVELARNRIDAGAILELVNRGEMNLDFAMASLERLGYTTGDAGMILATRRNLLTPAALADMVVRDIMAEDQAAGIANQSGLSTEDFHALVLDTGEAPGLQDLLFSHRRGFIDQARLEHGIRQSRVRNEWIDVIESLAFVPMSTADAIEGAVQGALTLEQSQSIAAQNGLMVEHWKPLYDIAGNPPGVQQMVSYWHRGKLTRDELVKGIQESRLKNKYIDIVIEGSETLPPERTIVSLVSKGSLTEDQGLDLLLKRGYAPDIASALMANAHATKTVTARTLTYTMVTDLYEAQAMPRDQAVTILEGLGYSEVDAGWILDLADINRTNKYRQAAITKVGSSYTKGLTDKNTTNLDLLNLGLPQPQIDLILSYWDLEIGTVTKTLTEAQVVAAAKRGDIPPDEAVSRLKGMGYGDNDVAILLAAVVPPTTPPAGGTGTTA